MAIVSVSNANSRVQDMEGAVSGTSNIGGGAGVQAEPDFIYQGLQSWSRKVSSASGNGFYVTVGTATNMTTAGSRVWMSKTTLTNSAAINSNGLRVYIGSTTSANYEYMLLDDGSAGAGELQYPIRGGWIIQPIDPNVTAWRDVTNGSPSLSAVDVFGITAGVSATSKAENLAMDAIDIGDGLWLVGGDGASTDGKFSDFVSADEGSQTSGRFGHIQTTEGLILVYGTLGIGRTASGTTTATEFTDSLRTVVFPGGRVDSGWNRLFIDLGNAGTAVSWESLSVSGRGRDNLKVWFDVKNQVTGGATDSIDVTSHGFLTGDAVLYSSEGGTALGGLTHNTQYFVEKISDNSFHLHTSRQNAYSGATPISITPSGTSAAHSLRRQPDTRPDLEVTGASGTFQDSKSVFQALRNITLTSGCTLTNTSFVGCTSLTIGGGTLSSCSITDPLVSHGEAFVTATSASELSGSIDGSEFASLGVGSAAEITTTAGTVNLQDVSFTGYGNDPDPGKGMEFNTETSVNSSTNIITYVGHGWTTGDAVFYSKYNGGVAGTESIGLTDQTMYFVRAATADTITLHPTKYAAENNLDTISLTASGAGSGETHTLYSMDAAIINSTGGSVTINVTSGDTPSIRNVGASTTVVQNTVPVTITVVDEQNTPIQLAQVAVYNSSNVAIINADTDASGVASSSYNYVGDETVSIRVRKNSPGAQRYFPVNSTGVVTSTGLNTTVTLIPDSIASS